MSEDLYQIVPPVNLDIPCSECGAVRPWSAIDHNSGRVLCAECLEDRKHRIGPRALTIVRPVEACSWSPPLGSAEARRRELAAEMGTTPDDILVRRTVAEERISH